MYSKPFRRRPAAISTVAALLVLATSPAAVAQDTRKWDAAGFGGIFAAHVPVSADRQSYEDWFRAGQGGVSLGRYLTPHLKLDVEASGTGLGRQFIQQFVTVPGSSVPYPVGSEAETTFRSIGTAATWQFFENQWVHPFVSAGVAAEVERRSVRIWDQRYYGGDPRLSGNAILIAAEGRQGPTTTWVTRGVVGGGAKLYVAERAFIRTEGRWSVGSGRHHVAFRIGAGIDF